jgi:RNA polymerase-binding transcription factor DksA
MDEAGTARERLESERTTTVERLEAMRHGYDEVVDAAEDSNADDEHDPEGATIAYERSQLGALVDQTQAHLDEIDAALARVEAGTYGRCEVCGAAIPVERLEARPTARTCVEHAGHSARP